MQQFVFVSHASKDKVERRTELRHLLDALIASRIKVWIDKPEQLGYTADRIERDFLRLHAGGTWDDEIDEAHAKAGVVLAVWSANVVAAFPAGASGAGHVLRDEIIKARENGKLVCCRIDDTSPTTYPDGLDRQQVTDIRPHGPHFSSELSGLVADIKDKLRAPFFHEYRQNRIAEWSRDRYGAGDRLFTELSLLLDRGADRDERWNPKKSADGKIDTYETLGAVLEKNPDYLAFVLLGAPGSGKSTLLRHFDLDTARRAEARKAGSGTPIPFSYFVSLKEYRTADGSPPASPLQWLRAKWNSEWRKEDRHVQEIDELLQEPDSYLLLDALNEMPRSASKDYEQLVADWKAFIADVRARRWKCRIVFSCRSLLYSNRLSAAGEEMVPHVEILPLDRPTIRAFLGHYAGDKAPALFERIQDQLDLYSTAYFLRMLVDVAGETGDVPGDRAALLTAFTRKLLAREYGKGTAVITRAGPLSVDDVDRLDRLAFDDQGWRTPYELLERGPLFRQLAALAFGMQTRSHGAEATEEHLQLVVDRDDALHVLEPAGGSDREAQDILLAACELSLLEHDRARDEVQFAHQLIQEYFAGRRLAEQPDPKLVRVGWRADEVEAKVPENINEPLPPVDSTGWEETTLFAVLMAKDREAFVEGLIGVNLPLAGRAAAQVRSSKTQRPGARSREAPLLSDALITRIRDMLRQRMIDAKADLRSRIAAGRALGELGDTRFADGKASRGGRAFLTPPAMLVPGGTYSIGRDRPVHAYEGPRCTVDLDAFYIAQFPVTNAEWRCFMEAGGYEVERWWPTEAARLWRSGETTHVSRTVQWYAFRRMLRESRLNEDPDYLDRKLATKELSPRAAEDHRKARDQTDEEFAASMRIDFGGGRHVEPRRWRDRNFNNPLQPVVGISWYEACAYCAWLSEQSGEKWRLPTEAEWEAAAGLGAPDASDYPWGPRFDAGRCNSFESHIRATTPVGLYLGLPRQGGFLEVVASAFRRKPEIELADMSGNVFEWTASCYDKQRYRYPYGKDDGREEPECQPGRNDATSQIMVADLLARATDEGWPEDKARRAITAASYFPRVLRGGSFYYSKDEARSAFRLRFHPGYHNQSTGFRLVRDKVE